MLGDEMAASLTPASSDFWIMATALRGFVDQEGGGKLPVQVRGKWVWAWVGWGGEGGSQIWPSGFGRRPCAGCD